MTNDVARFEELARHLSELLSAWQEATSRRKAEVEDEAEAASALPRANAQGGI